MIAAFKITLGILLVFTAIGLLCAVRVGRRRPPPADPFAHPFGDVPGPYVHRDLLSGGPAIPPDAGSGKPSVLSGDAAARASIIAKPYKLTKPEADEIRERWRKLHRAI